MLRRRRLLKGGQSRPAAAPHVVVYHGRDNPRNDNAESDNACCINQQVMEAKEGV